MSGLAGEVATMRWLQDSPHENLELPIPKSQTSDSQSVVSGHGQVESRLADVSLHPVNGLTGSSSKEFGIEQLDDIWGVKSTHSLLCVCMRARACVCVSV